MSSQIWLNIQSLFWEMQLYMSWYIRSFFGFTFLNILYFFKYSCTNIFHRRSLYTFYWCRQWLAAWRYQAITWTIVDFPLITPLGIFHSNSIWNHTRKYIHLDLLSAKYQPFRSHPSCVVVRSPLPSSIIAILALLSGQPPATTFTHDLHQWQSARGSPLQLKYMLKVTSTSTNHI